MGTTKLCSLAMLIAGVLLVSACESSQVGRQQILAQEIGSQQNPADSPVCQSKWIAAGNNGAKADRYFQVSC